MRESDEEGDGDGEDGKRGFDASFSGHLFFPNLLLFFLSVILYVNVNRAES